MKGNVKSWQHKKLEKLFYLDTTLPNSINLTHEAKHIPIPSFDQIKGHNKDRWCFHSARTHTTSENGMLLTVENLETSSINLGYQA